MIKNETLKKILPSSILLNPIGKNGNEIWIEDFEQIYPLFFKSILEIQKADISEFSGFGEFTEDGKPEYSTFQAFLIKSFDDSNDDYWKNWKELFNTSMMKKEFFEKYFNKMIELGSFCQNQRNKRNFPRLRHAKQPSNPMQYILSKRISNAETLLLDHSYNITEIAQIVGYDNPLYFSRIFKKIKGLSPSEYRKNINTN